MASKRSLSEWVFVGESDVWRTKILFEFKHLQVSEEYGDLEKLSESELMEILKSLEADEENEENLLEEVFWEQKRQKSDKDPRVRIINCLTSPVLNWVEVSRIRLW